jgi:hypothetical protein
MKPYKRIFKESNETLKMFLIDLKKDPSINKLKDVQFELDYENSLRIKGRGLLLIIRKDKDNPFNEFIVEGPGLNDKQDSYKKIFSLVKNKIKSYYGVNK